MPSIEPEPTEPIGQAESITIVGASNISLTPTNSQLTVQLSEGLDSNNLTWTSGNTNIITVTPSANNTTATVAMVGPGTTTVTVSCSGADPVTYSIEVNPWKVWGLTSEDIQFNTDYVSTSSSSVTAKLCSTDPIIFLSWSAPDGVAFADLNPNGTPSTYITIIDDNIIIIFSDRANDDDNIFDLCYAIYYIDDQYYMYMGDLASLELTPANVNNLSSSTKTTIKGIMIDTDTNGNPQNYLWVAEAVEEN